ncbi:MAG: hypothetical protein GY862_18485, partial [Gammaproteobacteria bacterium]|nr:hypothetical protein [Gammaproteobacteria bacterium]
MKNHKAFRLTNVAVVCLLYYTLLMAGSPAPAMAEQAVPAAEAPAAAMAGALHALNGILKARKNAAEPGVRRGLRAAWQPLNLGPVRQEIQILDTEIRADFAGIETDLHGLPEEILRRHFDTAAQYEQNMDILLQNLAAVEAAETPEREIGAIDRTLAHFEPLQPDMRMPADPGRLPFNMAKKETRAPVETEAEYRRLIPPGFGIRVRQERPVVRQERPVRRAKTAPSPEYLASEAEVQITPEIKALAKSLSNNPVFIYNWAHDNLEFIATYGSVQGSQMTLDSRRGNAFDTASVLISLLRA